MDEILIRKRLADLAVELDGAPPYETRTICMSLGELIAVIRALELVAMMRAVIK